MTYDELQRWKRGDLVAEDVAGVAHHLEACADCAALAARSVRADAAERAVRAQLEDEHPDLERLFGYVDGTLGPEQRLAVATHIESCRRCAEDVRDGFATKAAGARHHTRPPARAARWLAVAAVLTIVIAAMLFAFLRERNPQRTRGPLPVTKTTPAPPQPVVEPPRARYQRLEWSTLVREARNGAVIAIPAAVAAMHRDPDVLRAPGGGAAAVLAPVGVSVETQRPAFTWPATRGASYVVTVFAGEREVARSKRLTQATWKPSRDLQRGTTYTWQVEIETAGELRIVPEPPAPPARFHIVDTATVAELEAARQAHPGDHLLLGLLAARAGLADRARDELLRVESPEDRAVAARVLRDVESWTAPEAAKGR